VHVSGRDPAADISPFESGNDFHRLRTILTNMTDEQEWIRHGILSIFDTWPILREPVFRAGKSCSR
jgi:hypothetical protein